MALHSVGELQSRHVDSQSHHIGAVEPTTSPSATTPQRIHIRAVEISGIALSLKDSLTERPDTLQAGARDDLFHSPSDLKIMVITKRIDG